ncbi:MAG: branched-chain amino acid ABC transporter substrate-binding protein [Pirellulales bacterium]|nr:branched-chain amino acid ABC transporter substrate-binding protein [Pirellulales bacterium]
MHRIHFWTVWASTAAAACICGCNTSSSTPSGSTTATLRVNPDAPKSGAIRIVSSLPRTGSAKQQSDTIVNGIKMAFDEAEYKVGDFTIEYSDLDDATAAAGQWTAESEAANAKEAANDPNVMVYIGPYNSGAAKTSMPILNNVGLLMISPAVSAVGLTKPGKGEDNEPGVYRPTGKPNFTRVVPADDLQGSYGADWAHQLGIKSAYILDDNQVYGKGLADIFRDRCQELEIEVLGQDSIDEKEQDFKPLMTKIKSTNPDMIYFGGTTQTKGGQICKDMVAAGLNCKLMVPDGCYEAAFIEAAGPENANGRVYATFGGLPPKNQVGKGKEFVEKYQEKYGSMPEAYAIYGYEAGKVALEAIRQAGVKDRAAILGAAFLIKDFDGALGKWSFDENGDTTLKKLSGSIVRDGDFEFVRILGEEKN